MISLKARNWNLGSLTKLLTALVLVAALNVILAENAKAAAPMNLLSNYLGAGQMQLTWKSTGNPADTYNIWRSTDGNTWTKLNVTTSNSLTYTDSTVAEYVNYFYVVTTTAVNSYPTGSDGTNTTNVSKAYPPDINKHEYYTEATNLCSECHETHAAQGAHLINQNTVQDLCLFCHDGSGSKYNVIEGTTLYQASATLNSPAGPFGYALNGSGRLDITSVHIPGLALSTAPGGDELASSEAWSAELNCSSCHQPHTPGNYRLLRMDLPSTTGATVTAFAKTDPANSRESVTYKGGVSTFCTGCHTDFMAGTGSGHTAQTATYSTTIGEFRHSVGVAPSSYNKKSLTTTLPLEGTDVGNYNNNKVMCLTCHMAHGSTVVWTTSVPAPYNVNTMYDDSFLLRSAAGSSGNANVNLCQDCHNINPVTGQ